MQSKKVALSLLLVIAIIVKALNIDPIINIIALFLSCFVISYNCFNKVEESIKYAIFLVIIFELLKVLLSVNKYTFAEHLENENLKKTHNDDKSDKLCVVLDFGGDKTCTNGTFKITYPDPSTPANAIISMS